MGAHHYLIVRRWFSRGKRRSEKVNWLRAEVQLLKKRLAEQDSKLQDLKEENRMIPERLSEVRRIVSKKMDELIVIGKRVRHPFFARADPD